MIVRQLDGRILLITQPDHAHLAGRIMSHATALKNHPRRDSILRAVAEHDAGWQVEDQNPRVDPALGNVLDFIHAATDVRQGVWPRGVAIVSEADRYSAALIAQHALTVYSRLHGSAEWQEFFAEMAAVRDGLLSTLGVPLAQLEEDYTFVRLGDLISLAFCTGTDALNQFGEWRVTLNGNRVTIAPDIFGGEQIPLSVSAMEIPAKKYRSDEELAAVVKWPRHVTLHGVVSGL